MLDVRYLPSAFGGSDVHQFLPRFDWTLAGSGERTIIYYIDFWQEICHSIYVTWNYLVTPFLFMRDDLDFERLEPLSAESEYPLQLKVSFPRDFSTHCRTQIFYFGRNYLPRRLDYTAEVVSRWARAAHICENYQNFDGFKIPTKRRVLPLWRGIKPLTGPVIVAIDIYELTLLSSAGSASRAYRQPGSV